MKKQFIALTKKSFYLVLSAAFVISVAASASAVTIPTGKSGDDYVNEAKGHIKSISVDEAKKIMESTPNVVLLDIRSFEEFKEHGWIEGRTVLPHGMVIFKIKEIVPNKSVPIIVYCKKGKRSALVTYQLHQMGYVNVKYMEGGILTWKRKGFPAVSSGISKIAEKAVVYHNHQAGGNFTVPGTASLLTGTYPWTHRALHHDGGIHPAVDVPNMFDLFMPTYQTFAYSHNPFTNNLQSIIR